MGYDKKNRPPFKTQQDLDTCLEELLALDVYVQSLREQIAESARAFAEADSMTMSLAQIGTMINDMQGRIVKLDDRLKREIDGRQASIMDQTHHLRAEKDASANLAAAVRQDLDNAEAELARLKRDTARELEANATAYRDLQQLHNEDRGAATAALLKILQRPHRLLDLYGPDVYAAIKDTFVSLGGDQSLVLAPEVARHVEDGAAVDG